MPKRVAPRGSKRRSPTPPARTGYATESYTSAIDGSTQPFALWVPPAYTPARAYPLLVALHGMDADHRMIPEDCFQAQRRGFHDEMILLSPFGRGDLGFRWMGEADLWDTIAWVLSRYSIDPRRQYLTGLSMGGYATWRLACRYPEQWAAIAPVCGGGDPAALRALRDIPVWCVHGDADDQVPVSESRRLIEELRRQRCLHRYTELADRGHDSWRWLYDPDRRSDTLVDWLLQFQRATPAPARTTPARTGGFMDVFNEPLVISVPATTPIPHEAALLRREAEAIARFRFGDHIMRQGHLVVRTDAELADQALGAANHLMLGRTDNHRWLGRVARRLDARHVQRKLIAGGTPYLSKSIAVATCQTSPWNPRRLLATITYQQFHQLPGAVAMLFNFNSATEPGARNILDTDERRFLRRDPAQA
jgi:pimeloyl-ACP methyl ester carboxylesterase